MPPIISSVRQRCRFVLISLLVLAQLFPASLLAAQIGLIVFRRITDNVFRRLLIGLSLVLGLGILIRALVIVRASHPVPGSFRHGCVLGSEQIGLAAA